MTGRDTPNANTNGLSRRRVLGATGLAAAALAGCLGDDGDGTGGEEPSTESGPSPPPSARVEDPPSAVYKPTHSEGMAHLSAVEAGEYTVTPMVSYAHEFWLVTGTETERVVPSGAGVHLMLTVWDGETGRVLPVDAGAQIEVFKDGDRIDRRAPWPMISQSMGFHFGDNVTLSEAGTYTVELDLNPIDTRKTGGFAGRFEDDATATFEFEWSRDREAELVEAASYVDESEWGDPGAVGPMGMDMGGDGEMDGEMDGGHGMPYSALPSADAYPGRDLGQPTSGDATFVVRYLGASRLADDDGGYLLVSPRTPYNRVPLPDMALSVEGAHEGTLVQTLDDEFGLHYGTSADLAAGDELELVVEAPPQVARHTGYETAFLDMPSMTIEVPQ